MGNLDRARQFMPFDALKGLQEALREKEREIESRKELSEESLAELDCKLKRLSEGCSATVKYYKNERYISITGIVTNIDTIKEVITIDNTEFIKFFNIIDIN